MKLLLDSHAFIWWSSEPEKLSARARACCEDSSNILMLSVASVWEMQIKLQLGKLQLVAPLQTLIENQQRSNDLQILRIAIEHAFALDTLPLHHKDPFDRMLIAQSNVEELFVVTKDEIFSAYPVKLIW
ncbi:MAG: type II toxin-antitoxin system VapC family toxin [bacterium]